MGEFVFGANFKQRPETVSPKLFLLLRVPSKLNPKRERARQSITEEGTSCCSGVYATAAALLRSLPPLIIESLPLPVALPLASL